MMIHVIKFSGTPEAVKVADEWIIEIIILISLISGFPKLILSFGKKSWYAI